MSEDMHILETYRSSCVFFVRDADESRLEDYKGKDRIIYKQGLVGDADFDENAYSDFIDKKGYAPSLKKVAIEPILPMPNMIVPGIEIFQKSSHFEGGGNIFYAILEGFGLDYSSNNPSRREIYATRRTRKVTRERINRFLKDELYKPLRKGRKEYEKNLFKIIKNNISHPENLFSIRVLQKPKAKWQSFDSFDLEEAIEKNIRIDIDWFWANKILGLYATQ